MRTRTITADVVPYSDPEGYARVVALREGMNPLSVRKDYGSRQ